MTKINIINEYFKSIEEFIKQKSVPHLEIQLVWIGQAGFIFKFENLLLIIDPYLSDFLSKKYQGKIFPHVRLMKIPIVPDKIKRVDYIISTHSHSDHMDPETLSILSKNNPDCKFIVPSATTEEAICRGIQKKQLIPALADEIIKLEKDLKIIPIPAAHESLKVNEKEEHYFLGFILFFGDISIYHSGDCVPYDGLTHRLKQYEIDLALLPINGRDEYCFNNGIAGNFHAEEAIKLCQNANIKSLLVHHFGMFAYNTLSERDLNSLKALNLSDLKIIVPEIRKIYRILK